MFTTIPLLGILAAETHSHPATWITAIAWLCMALAAGSALAIVVDIARGLWFYFRYSRRDEPPRWAVFGKAVSHCGAECGRLRSIWAAFKADTLSIVAFQAGLFAGMAVYQRLIFSPPLAHDDPVYWMMMQLAMVLGFSTAWPMNAWLVRRGLKEEM